MSAWLLAMSRGRWAAPVSHEAPDTRPTSAQRPSGAPACPPGWHLLLVAGPPQMSGATWLGVAGGDGRQVRLCF